MRRPYRLFYPQSWRPSLNPFAERARLASNRWFHELGLIGDAQAKKVLEEERPDLYGGLPYPTASFDKLTLLTKFLALWMLFDDLVTETTLDNGPSLADYRMALCERRLPAHADPWLRGWWSLGQSFAERMSDAWCRRLWSAFLEWLAITVRERETYRALKRADRLPSVETYTEIRSVSVGAIPTFLFIQLVEGFELPEEVMAHEQIRALHALGARIIFLANDVLGLQKDLRAGWPNLVSVSQREQHLSLADACERVVGLHNREVAAFCAAESQLPSFGPDVDFFVRHYVERMHVVICGFAEFERHAERYQWTAESDFAVALCTFSEA